MNRPWDEVAAWLAARADTTIETSCARVFLAGEVAWKVKRPVRYEFLDFSSLEKRKWALDRELAFNRRWSGDLYRAVRAVTRRDGVLAIDGAGEIIEWLLEMRRFDTGAVLAARPEAVTPQLYEALGRRIARMHVEAPPAADGGGVAALGYTIATNEKSLKRVAGRLGADKVGQLIAATRVEFDRLAPVLKARRVAGFARHCHGDLHLGNILLEDGEPMPFDCIEFNDRLSLIDVLYDAAFPIMDLIARGNGAAANALMNAWFDEVARGFPPELWGGLAALPLFLSVRAAVRAHVGASTGDDNVARGYLDAAVRLLAPPTPRLTAIGGFSGSGKSVTASAMAARRPPGAVVLRSDLVRKRLWGVKPLDRLPREAYVLDWDGRVYGEMFEVAARALGAGWPVILDATFLDPAMREAAEVLAARLGVPFDGVWLEVEAEVLRARLAARTSDASDADVAVLEGQLTRDPGRVTWRGLSIQSAAKPRTLEERPCSG
ncbi:MAG: AAA family ATPase [Caulobacteraceae bacterium]